MATFTSEELNAIAQAPMSSIDSPSDAPRDRIPSHIVIEHNLDVIRCSDWTIILQIGFANDLGPKGGNNGGELVAVGTPEQVAKNPKSHTGKYLKQVLKQHDLSGKT